MVKIEVPLDFHSWIKRRYRNISSLLLMLLGAANVIASSFFWIKDKVGITGHVPDPKAIRRIADIIQIAAVSGLIIIVSSLRPRQPANKDARMNIATAGMHQFCAWYRYLLISWLFLYSYWVFSSIVPANDIHIVETILLAFTNLCLVGCYLILSEKTDPARSEEAALHLSPQFNALIARWSVLLILAILVQAVFHSLEMTRAANWVMGLTSMFFLVVFVSRLDSEMLAVPKYIVVVLYTYALIQPLIVEFDSSIVRGIATGYALLMKLVLSVVVMWLVEEGRLVYYMMRVRNEIDGGSKEFFDLMCNASLPTDGLLSSSSRPGAEAIVNAPAADAPKIELL